MNSKPAARQRKRKSFFLWLKNRSELADRSGGHRTAAGANVFD
jgi:hypothetical protein